MLLSSRVVKIKLNFIKIKSTSVSFRTASKMASCFSSAGQFALAPICVLSKIKGLKQNLTELAPPGVQIKHLDLWDGSSKTKWMESNIDFLKEVEIAVCDGDILSEIHSSMTNLKWAHITWAGVNPLIEAIPNEPSFVVTRHAGGDFCNLMAEYVLCHILNCERKTKLCWKNQEEKVWGDDQVFANFKSLDQITVSILGIGNMGSAIAEILKSRGTTVYGLAKHKRPETCNRLFDKISCHPEEVLADCDYVCNTLPCTPATRGLLSAELLLRSFNKSPVFVNVGRGSIIREEELVDALRRGVLSGAVLDVFENEPLPPSSPLWDMPQVTITPHVSALSRPEDVASNFFENLRGYVDGHGLRNVVRWAEGY